MDFYVTAGYKEASKRMPEGYKWLFPASSWFNQDTGEFRKPNLPALDHFAIDCGGFVAARKWGGAYRYTATQYINWIYQFQTFPQWAAIQDYCCEDEITTGNSGVVRQRQQMTTHKIEKFYRDYRHLPWCWIPTVQGWRVEEYINHAIEIKPLVEQWQKFYAARGQSALFRVGIGTLCARPFTADIQAIVCAVADILPDVSFHLWGVKLQVLKSKVQLPRITSVDSAAWNGLFGKDRHKAREIYQALNITKRAYEFDIALPQYMGKVQHALQQPKQMTLWAS